MNVEDTIKAITPVDSKSVLQIVETNTLLMEYVRLPIIDLSARFLYRFVEPVPTGWVEGRITMFEMFEMKTYEEVLNKFALKEWVEIWNRSLTEGERPFLIKDVKLRECMIVPKE